MRPALRNTALAAAAVATTLMAPTASEAAVPNDLCRTAVATNIYISPNELYTVGRGVLVRILSYYGDGYYLVRKDDVVGIIERVAINQSSCYQQ